MKILMVHAEAVINDSRLEKEAHSLSLAGHEVYILGWDRSLSLKKREEMNGYVIHRLRFPSFNGQKSVLAWPFWWILQFVWMIRFDYDVCHVVNFPSLPIGLLASKLKRKKCIHDVFDYYPDTQYLPPLVYHVFDSLYSRLLSWCDKIIIVDADRISQIKVKNTSAIEIIYNTPQDVQINNEIAPPVLWGNTEDTRILWAGYLSSDRDVLSVMKIVQSISGFSMVIAGRGDKKSVDDVVNLAQLSEATLFVGEISYDTVLAYTHMADILFVLYNPSIPNNRLASPNKLFESMMCAKPIIVNDGTSVANKVREENCGLVVPYGDYEALKEAVLTLKNNPELRKELGENGRRAYETKYNWRIMEKRLLNLYAPLEKEQ